MDMIKSPEDDTQLVRIMDDLDKFILQPRRRGDSASNLTRPRRPGAGESIASRLQFDSPCGGESGKRKRSSQDSELLSAKCKIANLENKVMLLENEKSRAQLKLDTDSENKVHNLFQKEDQIADLRSQLKYISDKEKKAVEKLKEEKRTHEQNVTELKSELKILRQENEDVRERLSKKEQLYTSQILKLQEGVSRLSQEKIVAETSFGEMEAKYELFQRKSAKMITVQEENLTLTEKVMKLELESKELKLKLMKFEDANDVVELMRNEIPRLKELERQNTLLKAENKSLREGRSNFALLEEKYNSLQLKYEKAKESLNLMRKMEIENEDLKSKISKWEAEDIGGENKRPRSPTELSRIISEMQKQQLTMTQEKCDMKHSLSVKDSLLSQLSEKLKMRNEELNEFKRKSKQQGDQIKTIQRKLDYATKEREGTRRILASYDQQDSADSTPQLTMRLKEAEDRISEKNEQVTTLENELEAIQKERNNLQDAHDKITADLKQLEQTASTVKKDIAPVVDRSEEITKLQKLNSELQEKNDILEARIEQWHLRGHYDPTKMKVLHLAKNPMSLAKTMHTQEIEKLREENEKLHRKVRKLESGMNSSMMESEVSSKEVKALKVQLQSGELKMKRMKEAFVSKAEQFREAATRLFGYQLDLPGPEQFKVTSFFAESENDYFNFRLGGNGEMQIIETDYSLRCRSKIEEHLGLVTWIPAFLSSLTIELSNSQTSLLDSTTFASSTMLS